MSSEKLLVVGSVNSHFGTFLSKISKMNSKHGPFTAILSPGNFFSAEDSSKNSLEALTSAIQKTPPPCTIYFIAGSNGVPEMLDELMTKYGQVTEHVVYLGTKGVYNTSSGLKIAYSSVISNEDDSLNTVSDADILLTNTWPSQIQNQSKTWKFDAGALDERVMGLVSNIKPRYHFAAGEFFWEREPFKHVGVKYVGRFIGLGDVGTKSKERWFYAYNIIPMKGIDLKVLDQQPQNTTSCPFITSNKRSAPSQSGNSFFWDEQGDRKRGRTDNAPPSSYVCNICKEPGHYIRDCPQKQQISAVPPPSYICNICNEPGHYIKDCPHKSARNDRDPNQCWFCLSSPTLEKHLIVHIGTELYLAQAKGPLTDSSHLIIVPINHYTSRRTLLANPTPEHKSYLQEVVELKQKVKAIMKKRGLMTICFESYVGYSGDPEDEEGRLAWKTRQHMITQIVGIPEELTDVVHPEFLAAAEREGLELTDTLPMDCDVGYISVEFEEKELIFKVGQEKMDWVRNELDLGNARVGTGINVRFGNSVVAGLLGTPERSNWKKFVLDFEKESEVTEQWKKEFK